MLLAVCPNPSIDTFIWVKSLDPGKVHRAIREKIYPGGKGVHVALAAAEMGEKVMLLGFWGGETGRWIKEECGKNNIYCLGPELKEWTRSCYTFKSESHFDDTEVLGIGPEITPVVFEKFITIFREQVENARMITLSGSWPKGSPDDGYALLIKESKKSDKPIFLDATGKPFRQGLKEKPDAIHLNYAESKEITGLSDIGEMIGYFRNYSHLIAITAGPKGLYLSINGEILHGNVILDQPVYSAVGSGDCLTAGLAIGTMNQMTSLELLKLGVACGGANCLREDLGMLYRKDVERLKEKVIITQIRTGLEPDSF
jgi:tagatose 6-phosphate kinase